MDKNFQDLFFNLWQKIIGYLPNLFAGILLLFLGWLLGWFTKRIVIQLLAVLKFDKLFTRFKWKNAVSKADIRFALYNFIGNIVFFIVFLIFLNSALDAMNLLILSHLIQQGVLFIPKLIIASIILGAGFLIASRSSGAVFHTLLKENIQYAALISKFIKFVIILFFSAMALEEIDLASEIVVIGFTTVIVTMSIITIIIAVVGKGSIKNFFQN
ncbi:MAG: hypothetical protein K8H86_10105 [Ignavibacteriaceae bacterium]|nr:hypothetical protein [Ignavibacteriaceae bacterium]